jgi:hypothetical protein
MKRTFEEYINEAIANKQITVSLNSDKRELTFQFKGLFPKALTTAMGKALKANKFVVDENEFTIYL